VQIEIWSDIVCPWCAIGKRRLELALERFPHADAVEVVWRSFELDPDAPATSDVDLVERLATKYGVSREQAAAMDERVTRIAAEDGLRFRFDVARPGNTFDAHRLLHLAAERGVQHAVADRLLAGYQSEGEPIADPDALVRLAVQGGLDADEVRAVLAGDRYADAVRADEAEARALGVRGVPFFVFDRRYAVSGAQPADLLLEVLERAWADAAPHEAVPGAAEGTDACGPDGCALPETAGARVGPPA
jgi:predicted DsbA family dithiol-disulfide isomerase